MKKRFDSFLKFLQTLSLRVTLALLFFVLLMIQGLIAFLTRFQDPNILVLSSILTLVVGIITSSLLTSLTDDWKVNRERQEILKQAAEAFQNKNRATFDHIAAQFLEFYSEHRRIKLAKELPRFSEWYFEWMARQAQTQEWKKVFEQFTALDPIFTQDHEPLAALIHFTERLDDPTQLDSLLACLQQLPTPANLKLLDYHKHVIKKAAAANSGLNEQLFTFASDKMAEARQDAEFVIKFVLGRTLLSEQSSPKPPSWFAVVGLDETKLDNLNHRSENEPEDFLASEFVVSLEPNFLPNLSKPKKHIAVIGGIGMGKTFHKKQLYWKCKTDAQCLYVEWNAWKEELEENTISPKALRAGFMQDLYNASQAHSALKGQIEDDAKIDNYKKIFRERAIERVYLVIELGDGQQVPFSGREPQRMSDLFNALPDGLVAGRPPFFYRLFLARLPLPGESGSQSIGGPIGAVDALDIDKIYLRWTNDSKTELVKTRLSSLFSNTRKQWEGIVWKPKEDPARQPMETTLPEEIAEEFDTPREIVKFLYDLLRHKADLYAKSPTASAQLITRQEYESFLKEYRQ